MGDYLSNLTTNINSWENGLRDLLYEKKLIFRDLTYQSGSVVDSEVNFLKG